MNTIKYLILGIGTFLTFPPFFITPLAFIIFPLICLEFDKLEKLSKKNYFIFGFTFALGFLGLYFLWMINPFLVFEETKNYSFLSIILILIISLIFASIFYLCKIIFNTLIPNYFLVPLIFIIIEIFISRFIYGFPWLTFSLIISNLEFGLSLIKFTGTIFTGTFILLLFCTPYYIIKNSKIQKIIFIFSFFFIIFISITLTQNYFNKNKIEYDSLKVKIVQMNNSIDTYENLTLSKKYNQILDSIKNTKADLIIFGENNYPYLIESLNFSKIQSILNENQTIIFGGTRKDSKQYYNSLLLINKKEVKKFDKKILVPFGEFVPLRKYIRFMNKIAGPNDFTSGSDKRIISINNEYNFIPIICYEMIFYWKLINKINYDSDFIINITNDIWFGNYIGPYQHFYLTKLRASEFNKPLIRVSNNGISAIIDNNAQILKNTELNKYSEFEYKFKFNKNKTYYFIHKYFLLTLLLIFIAVIIFQYKQYKR